MGIRLTLVIGITLSLAITLLPGVTAAGTGPSPSASPTTAASTTKPATSGQRRSVLAAGAPYRWYFAEGTTRAGFQEYLTLENSGPATTVTITYEFADGGTRDRSVSLPAASRTSVDVNGDVGPGRDVAMVVDASGSGGVFAERPLYFNACLPLCTEGVHTAAGSHPDTQWYFAEGFTGRSFHEYLTLLNPNPAPASVSVVYSFVDGGSTQRSLSLPPTSRTTVDVNSQVGPELQVSALVTSDQPIVAERPMYFNACLGAVPICARGGHDSPGSGLDISWDFAEGYTGPGFQEFLLLLNPGSNPTAVTIDYFGQGGAIGGQSLSLAPHSRRTVDVNAVAGGQPLGARVRAAAPIAAERALYYHACAPICASGGAAAHGLSPAPGWDLAEGYTGAGFQEYITVANPDSRPAQVVVTYLTSNAPASLSFTVAASSRLTLDVNAQVGGGHEVSTHVSSDIPVVAERAMYFSGCVGSPPICANLPPRPASRVLNVPFLRQLYPLTCEAAALQMALAKESIRTDQNAILALTGIDRRAAIFDFWGHLLMWGNPNRTFVGDPSGSEAAYTGYGVYQGPIADAAGKLGGKVLRAGRSITPADLYNAVLDGHPIVAWVTFDYRYHPLQAYKTFDGDTVSLNIWEHAVTVVGVNGDSVLINDPLSRPTWHSKSEFESSYASFEQMAVVLD